MRFYRALAPCALGRVKGWTRQKKLVPCRLPCMALLLPERNMTIILGDYDDLRRSPLRNQIRRQFHCLFIVIGSIEEKGKIIDVIPRLMCEKGERVCLAVAVANGGFQVGAARLGTLHPCIQSHPMPLTHPICPHQGHIGRDIGDNIDVPLTRRMICNEDSS